LEQKKSAESEAERLKLCKKLALTCRSDDLDTNETAQKNGEKPREIDVDELEKELIDDEFFQDYLKKKIEEMNKKSLAL
jgi:hypothetical protein